MSKLTVADRKEYRKLMEQKQENLITALDGELFSNKEELIREELFKQNYQYNSDELESKIIALNSQIEDTVSEFLPGEEARLEVQIEESSNEVDQRIMECKVRYAAELATLQDEKKMIRTKLVGDHACLVDKLAMEKCGEKVIEKKKWAEDIERVKLIENAVEVEINRKVSLVRKMKYRIKSAINDRMNELFESLINTESKDECKVLLAAVPTIAELINSCQTPEGLAGLVGKLSAALALPAPPEPPKQEAPAQHEIKAEARVMPPETPTTGDNEGEETEEEPDEPEIEEEDDSETERRVAEVEPATAEDE